MPVYRNPMKLKIYTDGACNPNPGKGAWAFIILDENGEVVHTSADSEEDTTNNRMEYQALLNALTHVEPTDEVEAFSDSQLLVNTWNQWMHSWEAKGWKKKSGPISNLDLVQELASIKKRLPKVKLSWVRGHNGDKWNESVDEMCNSLVGDSDNHPDYF